MFGCDAAGHPGLAIPSVQDWKRARKDHPPLHVVAPSAPQPAALQPRSLNVPPTTVGSSCLRASKPGLGSFPSIMARRIPDEPRDVHARGNSVAVRAYPVFNDHICSCGGAAAKACPHSKCCRCCPGNGCTRHSTGASFRRY